MITIYGMPSCPDCAYLDEQIAGNPEFQMIDIGTNVKLLKAFIKIRDTDPAFAEIRGSGSLGIPCFVQEDGSVTLTPEEVGLRSRPMEEAV